MAKFVVQERARTGSGAPEFLVVNLEDQGRPVASFDDRASAEAHVEKLSKGPLDWDEQDNWKDSWDDDEE